MSQLALSALFEYLRYGSTAIINILIFQCGDRLYMSESDMSIPALKGLMDKSTTRQFICYVDVTPYAAGTAYGIYMRFQANVGTNQFTSNCSKSCGR